MLLEKIQEAASRIHTEVVGIRRHLHAHPERSFKEYQTGAFIADTLRSWGIPCIHPVAGTGVVAYIQGEAGDGPLRALRADIDALPIQEVSQQPYRSQNEDVMHACGHDVHTASLLGTARILWEMRKMLHGSFRLIFQPGEEEAPGGPV
ncbi:MAG: amidohydrolase [Saprospiraceae bacterium]